MASCIRCPNIQIPRLFGDFLQNQVSRVSWFPEGSSLLDSSQNPEISSRLQSISSSRGCFCRLMIPIFLKGMEKSWAGFLRASHWHEMPTSLQLGLSLLYHSLTLHFLEISHLLKNWRKLVPQSSPTKNKVEAADGYGTCTWTLFPQSTLKPFLVQFLCQSLVFAECLWLLCVVPFCFLPLQIK